MLGWEPVSTSHKHNCQLSIFRAVQFIQSIPWLNPGCQKLWLIISASSGSFLPQVWWDLHCRAAQECSISCHPEWVPWLYQNTTIVSYMVISTCNCVVQSCNTLLTSISPIKLNYYLLHRAQTGHINRSWKCTHVLLVIYMEMMHRQHILHVQWHPSTSIKHKYTMACSSSCIWRYHAPFLTCTWVPSKLHNPKFKCCRGVKIHFYSWNDIETKLFPSRCLSFHTTGKSHFLPLIKQFRDWKLKGTKYSLSILTHLGRKALGRYLSQRTGCSSGSSNLGEPRG